MESEVFLLLFKLLKLIAILFFVSITPLPILLLIGLGSFMGYDIWSQITNELKILWIEMVVKFDLPVFLGDPVSVIKNVIIFTFLFIITSFILFLVVRSKRNIKKLELTKN